MKGLVLFAFLNRFMRIKDPNELEYHIINVYNKNKRSAKTNDCCLACVLVIFLVYSITCQIRHPQFLYTHKVRNASNYK